MPKLELSAETVKKCEGGTTDLGITITQGVYPLKLEYQKGAVKHEFTYQSAADRLALTDVGVLYINLFNFRKSRVCDLSKQNGDRRKI